MSKGEQVLIGIDAGTTHCKVGLFGLDGSLNGQESHATPVKRAVEGYDYIDHESLWTLVAEAITGLVADCNMGLPGAIGIAGMAETGVLVGRKTGAARSRMIPWFDMSAAGKAEVLGREGQREARFFESGIFPAYKCSLAKVLWLRDDLGADVGGAVWLCAPDYLAYRLTGQMATDYSLAGRTYAFRIFEKQWDAAWLRQFGLKTDLWPEALQAGTKFGTTRSGILGIPAGVPVFIAGHDHICAAQAVGAIQPGVLLDSIGTAESLLGAFPERKMGKREFEAGFAVGCHVQPGTFYWLAGLSSAGGAVEWLRNLTDEEIPYERVNAMLEGLTSDPGDIIFLPYLAGSGTPHSEPAVRGALLGLRAIHRMPDLLKAVLEGTAYEIEFARRRAEALLGVKINQIVATGGGTRIPRWMQIRADVCGWPIQVAQTAEAVMLGAAMVAGWGAGIFGSLQEAATAMAKPATGVYSPEQQRHDRYADIFEQTFLKVQEPIRQLHRDGF